MPEYLHRKISRFLSNERISIVAILLSITSIGLQLRYAFITFFSLGFEMYGLCKFLQGLAFSQTHYVLLKP